MKHLEEEDARDVDKEDEIQDDRDGDRAANDPKVAEVLICGPAADA